MFKQFSQHLLRLLPKVGVVFVLMISMLALQNVLGFSKKTNKVYAYVASCSEPNGTVLSTCGGSCQENQQEECIGSRVVCVSTNACASFATSVPVSGCGNGVSVGGTACKNQGDSVMYRCLTGSTPSNPIWASLSCPSGQTCQGSSCKAVTVAPPPPVATPSPVSGANYCTSSCCYANTAGGYFVKQCTCSGPLLNGRCTVANGTCVNAQASACIPTNFCGSMQLDVSNASGEGCAQGGVQMPNGTVVYLCIAKNGNNVCTSPTPTPPPPVVTQPSPTPSALVCGGVTCTVQGTNTTPAPNKSVQCIMTALNPSTYPAGGVPSYQGQCALTVSTGTQNFSLTPVTANAAQFQPFTLHAGSYSCQFRACVTSNGSTTCTPWGTPPV